MALEVVVRPVVFPNIRPQSARVLVPDEDQGAFIMKGSTPRTMGVSKNWSVSVSRQLPQEESARVYNVERIYQMDEGGSEGGSEGGNVNKNNFVDVERMKKVRLDADDGEKRTSIQVDYAEADRQPLNVEIIEKDLVRRK